MAHTVEQIPNSITKLGEGPHWDIESQSLYYNDIYGGSVHRYDYKEKKLYSAIVDGENAVSFIIPVEGQQHKFAIGIGKRIGVIHWDGKANKTKVEKIVLEVEKEEKYKYNRFNDAKSDPKGRFFGGTMRLEEKGDIFEARLGNLYMYVPGQSAKVLREHVGVSNGLAWDETAKKMYYIDSCELDIKEYDYDVNTGNISNPRQLIDFRVNGEKPGFVPDGMTIDNKGNLYVATWGGSCILKVNTKTKQVEGKINIPAEQVTSCAFGGPNLDVLFVTTASQGNKAEPAGATFIVTNLGAVGTKMHKLRL